MIVATAGHVDHGKTSLIQALTGVDTDRLPEEKERGLTVDLGFAYLPIANGEVIGFVDVPGHEKFVRNMVAGIAGIDLGLVVVAADDGVMPQTREHVAVLDLLGVERAVVAVTKVDRSDRARIDAATQDVLSLLAETGLKAIAVHETAASGSDGIGGLLHSLTVEADTVVHHDSGGGFRLAVDRVFVVKGAGVVVTGMVHAGEAAVGDHLWAMPGGHDVRVRAIHAQDRPSETARRGDRAALNLAGIDRDALRRGDWIVTPALLTRSIRVDVMLRVLPTEAKALKHWTPVHVHHGAGHITGRVAILEGGAMVPGAEGLAQLVVDEPLVPAWGDRLVLRDQSARRTIAGARVIDPAGPVRGRARSERLARLATMDEDDPAAAITALLTLDDQGFDAHAFLAGRNIDPSGSADYLSAHDTLSFGPTDRRRVLLRRHWDALLAATVDTVRHDHAAHGDRLGPTLPELRRLLPQAPSPDLLDAAVRALVAEQTLVRRGAVVHTPEHSVELSGDDAALWNHVAIALEVETGSPPALFPLADQIDLSPSDLEGFLDRMVGYGMAVKIARNRYMTPDQVAESEAMAARTAEAFPEGFTAAQFRDTAGIGRNLAIDLLEHLDRSGVTQRRGDLRLLRDEP